MLTLFTMWGYDVDILKNDCQLIMNRGFDRCYQADLTYSKVYIDFSSMFAVDGKIIPELMMFLYQALNSGKELILFAPAGMETELEKHAVMPAMFHVILPDDMDTKLQSLEKDSIVIDGSYTVRKAVNRKGVPVFDLSMLESLIDHKA